MGSKAERLPSYLNIKTLAAELQVSETQIYNLVRGGIIPKPLKLGPGCVRWSWSRVQAALASLDEGGEADPDAAASDPFLKRVHDAKREAQGSRAAS